MRNAQETPGDVRGERPAPRGNRERRRQEREGRSQSSFAAPRRECRPHAADSREPVLSSGRGTVPSGFEILLWLHRGHGWEGTRPTGEMALRPGGPGSEDVGWPRRGLRQSSSHFPHKWLRKSPSHGDEDTAVAAAIARSLEADLFHVGPRGPPSPPSSSSPRPPPLSMSFTRLHLSP